jgi:cleavage and polyadenylation specificity factor subunit 1
MSVDGPVRWFSPFNNVNCPGGFIYFTFKSQLRISQLPPHMNYDADWPLRRSLYRMSVHKLAAHDESQTYSVVISKRMPFMLKDEDMQNLKEKLAEREGMREFTTYSFSSLFPFV